MIGVNVQNLRFLPGPAAVCVLGAALIHIQGTAAVCGVPVVLQKFYGVVGIVQDDVVLPFCGQLELVGGGGFLQIGFVDYVIAGADRVFRDGFFCVGGSGGCSGGRCPVGAGSPGEAAVTAGSGVGAGAVSAGMLRRASTAMQA